MRIRSHSESHVVELEDGSRWQIFPGDLDLTLDWTPETELVVEPIAFAVLPSLASGLWNHEVSTC
jgi:hypothetical protein